jgi:hypothetical protein
MDFKKLSPEQMKIAEMVIEAAEANRVDPNLLLAQAFRESGFKHIPNKDTDAFGVMQIRPSTAEQNQLGDITDLRTNIFGGAKLMRQYLDKYKSPEAALLAYHQGPGVADTYIKSGGDLKAVGPKGLDYVINIGENGGFGQPQESSNQESSQVNPFAGLKEEFAETNRLVQESNSNRKPEEEPAESGAPLAGAVVGAGANAILPMFMDEPRVTPRVDTGKAEEANLSARDKLELARRNLQNVAPEGTVDLEETYRQNQGELERLKNEQRLAQERLKSLPKAPPAMEIPAPPAPVDDVSRTKSGASGAVNYVNAMSDDVPEVLANKALNMRKDNPRGGQAIIDANAAAIQKQADLGLGDYGLTRTAGGVQLALPPTTVAERQADIEKQNQASQDELKQRTEQARLQQEAQAQQLEQQRLAHEADLERVRLQRAQLGQQQNQLSSDLKYVAPLQKAVTTSQNAAELAQRKLARAQQQPNAAGRVLENVGVGSTRMGAVPRAVVGGGLGYLGVMSYQEALERFKAGDTSEGVLKALQAGSAAAAILPPAGKKMTKVKGAGVASTVGLGGLELGRRLLKDRPPEE